MVHGRLAGCRAYRIRAGQHRSRGVDHVLAVGRKGRTDLDHHSAADPHVGFSGPSPGPVDQRSAPNEQVSCHPSPPCLAGAYRERGGLGAGDPDRAIRRIVDEAARVDAVLEDLPSSPASADTGRHPAAAPAWH